MHVPSLILTIALLAPAFMATDAYADAPAPAPSTADEEAPLYVRGDLPVQLDVACHTLDTDFDDLHAHGDQLCVLVLEQAGHLALLGQWVRSAPPGD